MKLNEYFWLLVNKLLIIVFLFVKIFHLFGLQYVFVYWEMMVRKYQDVTFVAKTKKKNTYAIARVHQFLKMKKIVRLFPINFRWL